MADFVRARVFVTNNTNLCHKVHVVLHDLDAVFRRAPSTILAPLTHSELDASEALSGEGVPYERGLEQVRHPVERVAQVRVKLTGRLLHLVTATAG